MIIIHKKLIIKIHSIIHKILIIMIKFKMLINFKINFIKINNIKILIIKIV
jgi:hypothetical protein